MPTPSRRVAAVLALVTGAGLLGLAGIEPGAMLAEETRYLAVLVSAALLGLALLEPRLPGPVGAAVLAVAWWIPGTGRPAVVLGLLVAVPLAVIAARASRRIDREGGLFGDGLGLCGFVVALQAVACSGLLLAPTWRSVFVDVVGPLVPVALASGLLARRRGPGIAVALLGLAALGPGIGWVGSLTLAGLALAERSDRLRWAGAIVPSASLSGPGVGGSVAVGLALSRRLPGLRRVLPAASAAAAGLAAVVIAGAHPGPIAALVPVLAPALLAPDLGTAAGLGLLALGSAFGTAVPVAGPDFLVPGLALVAWTADRARPVPAATLLLALVFGGAATVLGGYPWLRPGPVEVVAEGLLPEPLALWGAGLVALAILLDRWPRPLPAALVAGAALAALAVPAAPRVEQVLLDEAPATLSEGDSVLVLPWPAGASVLVVDTQLAHAQDLAPGQPVAGVWFWSPDGALVERTALRNGRDTGDWAAGREDLLGRVAAPPPWSYRVAADGTFFGQRYRARLHLPPHPEELRLELRRPRRLPPETEVVVHRVEARTETPR